MMLFEAEVSTNLLDKDCFMFSSNLLEFRKGKNMKTALKTSINEFAGELSSGIAMQWQSAQLEVLYT